MPTCQHCGREWNWKQSVRKSFALDTGMKCPHCGVKQFPSATSRKRLALLSCIPLFSMLLPAFTSLSAWAVFGILLGGYALILGLYPFMLQLTVTEEPHA